MLGIQQNMIISKDFEENERDGPSVARSGFDGKAMYP